jgi:HPt (histidine-containing phosphotransfer) domain-containing protein
MFVAETPILLQTIAGTTGQRRAEAAHRIVGSAVAIGAIALAEASGALERSPEDPAVLGRLESAASAALGAAADLLRTG